MAKKQQKKQNAPTAHSHGIPSGNGSAPAPLSPSYSNLAVHAGRLIRIEYIHERLCEVRAGKLKINCVSLGNELCRSRNTIGDDLQAMRDVFRAPVKYDPRLATLRYFEDPNEPYELRPRVHLDAVGALALVAMACASGTRVFPLGLGDALKQIAPLVDGSVSLDPAAIEGAISAPDDPATEADGRHFVILYDAIVRRRVVRMVYQKPASDASTQPREIQPLQLLLLADGCILVARDAAKGHVQNFALERIQSLEPTGATFAKPKDFDLQKYLAGRIGRFIGEPRHEVLVRFTAQQAAYVRAKPWQRGQVLVDLPDGRAEATYRVAHPREIEQRVMATCGGAEVIRPADVRERIRLAAAAMAASHAG